MTHNAPGKPSSTSTARRYKRSTYKPPTKQKGKPTMTAVNDRVRVALTNRNGKPSGTVNLTVTRIGEHGRMAGSTKLNGQEDTWFHAHQIVA